MQRMVVRPFRGYLPRADVTAEVICPAYDTIGAEDAAQLAKGHPWNLIHVLHPEVDLTDVTSTDPAVFQHGRDCLQRLIATNVIGRQERPGYFVYRQQQGDHIQRGFFGLASCEQYEQGAIKKHEATHAANESAGTVTLRTLNCNLSAVFLAYKSAENPYLANYITELTEKTQPDREARMSTDDSLHQLWIIDDESRVSTIAEMVGNLQGLYICDGHHRAASAYNIYNERRMAAGGRLPDDDPAAYFLAGIFADSQLQMLEFNRVVTGVTQQPSAIIAAIEREGFEISEFAGTESPNISGSIPAHFARPDVGMLSMYIKGQWYRLRFKRQPKSGSPVDRVDSQILTDYILAPVLHIGDLKTAKNVKFVAGVQGLKGLEKEVNSDDSVAFAVPPVSMSQLFAVADHGGVMPPKSTWFTPKLATGLVIRPIQAD